MPEQSRVVAPGPDARSVRTSNGEMLAIPAGWELLPPGDAALTRRVKAAGPSWTVQQKRGRKTFSQGIWALGVTIAKFREELEVERATPQHARRKEADAKRREKKQTVYVESFEQAVFAFLAFAPCHAALAEQLAKAVTVHTTPVGSGTVARTERIPIERRAEAAVIAWLRHQTTGYDTMMIPRVKGKRREVRQLLARRSQEMLARYRAGEIIENCLLTKALSAKTASGNR